MEYATAQLAEEAAERMNKIKEPDWFCPLIKDKCRKDCVCFYEYRPTIVGLSGGKYHISLSGFCCTNSIITGEMNTWVQQ